MQKQDSTKKLNSTKKGVGVRHLILYQHFALVEIACNFRMAVDFLLVQRGKYVTQIRYLASRATHKMQSSNFCSEMGDRMMKQFLTAISQKSEMSFCLFGKAANFCFLASRTSR